MARTRVVAGLWNSARQVLERVPFEPRAPTLEGVRYRASRGRGVAPRVDVYVPDTPSETQRGRASVLVLHGGAFLVGSRRQRSVRYVATRLVQAGFVVGCADYRLLFRGGPLTAQLEDVAALTAFWRARSGEWSLDPERVALMGMSAGATLALLHAASLGAEERLHALVSVYALYDLVAANGPGGRLWRTALTGSGREETWAARSPLAVAERIEAPVLALHGTRDDLVPYEQVERFCAVRERSGRDTTLVTFDGEPHGWLQNPSAAAAESSMDQVIRWLR